MPAKPISRCVLLLSVALLAAACSAQVLGAPGTLPNGQRIPFPSGQQNVPETLPHPPLAVQQRPGSPQDQTSAQPGLPAVPASTAPSLLDKPAEPATVTLRGGQLSVTANNSSLTDILHQLAAASGMTIDGLDKDTRVFGTYGPGDPRDILSSLLDGAGYNVMMLGGTAAGAPRQLVLTVRNNAPVAQQPATAMAEQEDDQDDNNVPLNNYPPAGEIQTTPHPPAAPPQQQNSNGTPKSPQQILQEMLQQRQQQQQQSNPQ
jgi:hypothetical protein